MTVSQLKEKVRAICDESGIAMLGVFGSVARGQDRADSDVDLLVRFKKPVGLIELIRLEDRLEAALGRNVDLGVEGSLHPLIQEKAMKDMRILYEV